VELDREIQGVHERYWDEQEQRGLRKTVLLVEGDDDRSVVEAILAGRRRTWQTAVSVSVAGGRKQVQGRMGDNRFPHVYGLVDRDTWSAAEIAAQQAAVPNLVVTRGWCVENLFLDPGWLSGFDGAVAARVAAQREPWVRAGALWWTLQRAREGQQRWQEHLRWDYGRPREDLDTSAPDKLAGALVRLVPEAVRREARFDVDAVGEAFDRRCQEVFALSEEEQWRVGVHGKAAFAHLLVPALNEARYQQPASVWLADLAAAIGRPAPFDALVAMLLP
jgi:hypothetical protein